MRASPEEELDEATAFNLGDVEKAFCNRAGMIQAKAKRKFNDLLAEVIKLKHRQGEFAAVGATRKAGKENEPESASRSAKARSQKSAPGGRAIGSGNTCEH